jgi:hypothetical protein
LECKPDFADRVFEIETGLIERWASRYKLKMKYKMQISKIVQLAENQLRQYEDVSSTFKSEVCILIEDLQQEFRKEMDQPGCQMRTENLDVLVSQL